MKTCVFWQSIEHMQKSPFFVYPFMEPLSFSQTLIAPLATVIVQDVI